MRSRGYWVGEPNADLMELLLELCVYVDSKLSEKKVLQNQIYDMCLINYEVLTNLPR